MSLPHPFVLVIYIYIYNFFNLSGTCYVSDTVKTLIDEMIVPMLIAPHHAYMEANRIIKNANFTRLSTIKTCKRRTPRGTTHARRVIKVCQFINSFGIIVSIKS